jgi:CheY-like chemotaxis protein
LAKGKILVVEDNPRNMRLIGMALKAKGYLLLEATDGEEGLRMALEESPDLIIMDIQLPRIDGIEVTRRLRQGFDHVPIIALTAYAMKGDRERILEAGCDAYLAKPIDTRILPQMVEEILSR